MTAVVAILLWVVLLAVPAQAHKPSDSFLTLTVTDHVIEGRWDVALRDLDDAMGLDTDDDGFLTWAEVGGHWPEIHEYVFSRLDAKMGSVPCDRRPTADMIDRHTDGAYAVLKFVLECPHPTLRIELSYRLFFDLDAQHRGLAKMIAGEGVTSFIFSPERQQHTVTVGASEQWGTLLAYAHEGVHHIWGGIDHLLFLFALLLPSAVRRSADGWEAVNGLRTAAMEVSAVVTAFTIAHSVTLSLSALQIVSVPSRLVESVIAVSVAVAALNNLAPFVTERRWVVAFIFGLVHGFGFAGALADLGLVEGAKILALAGFNLGVEAGQLAAVSLFLPLAYGVRHLRLYRRVVMGGGSCAILVLALCWAIERAFDLRILSF